MTRRGTGDGQSVLLIAADDLLRFLTKLNVPLLYLNSTENERTISLLIIIPLSSLLKFNQSIN